MIKAIKNANRLGLKWPLDPRVQSSLGGLLSVCVVIAALIFAALFCGMLWMILNAVYSWDDVNKADEVIRNVGLALAALVGLPFLIWRSIVAQQQVQVAEQGQITDRINKAVEGLGAVRVIKTHRSVEKKKHENTPQRPSNEILSHPSIGNSGWGPKGFQSSEDHGFLETSSEERTEPNIEVRLGALYSLARIAQDSPRDHMPIMEILCAYIRQNAPCRSLVPSEKPRRVKLRSDIQTAINVIATRSPKNIRDEHESEFRLNLQDTDLSGGDFGGGIFTGAIFANSRLEGCKFDGCQLDGTRFNSSLLNYSRFNRANLTGSDWRGIVYNKGPLLPLHDSDITGLNVGDADITAIRITSDFQKKTTFGTIKTILQPHQANKLSSAMELKEKLDFAHMDGEPLETIESLQAELNNSPFRLWSEHGFDDGVTWTYYKDFREALNLTGWPYDDD